MVIRNIGELLSHGDKKGREIVLDIIEHAMKSVDPYEAVKKMVCLKDDKYLVVGDLHYNLTETTRIFVVGAGKGSFEIAKALDEILGNRIAMGCIIEKRGEHRRLEHIKVIEAGHPVPDEIGLEGTKEILEIVNEAKKGDIVFVCITGGASALMPLPAEQISLEDTKKVTDLLLKCGATINEINAVRKHISAIMGGRLALLIYPAEIINLIVIDEVAGLAWGPTVPDTTTFNDAVSVLNKYWLWKKVPMSARKALKAGMKDSSLETPKKKDFEGIRAHTFILGDNEKACEAAKKRASELGLQSMILSTVIEGESREVGIVLASIAKETEKSGRLLKSPCILIAGGETTVTINEEGGEGGPSQELVISFGLKISGDKKITIAAIDTDGTDGPTEVAGGLSDGYMLGRANDIGIDVSKTLTKHRSSIVLRELKDAIITGPTGTNVMDLIVIYISDKNIPKG
jgi:glycerate 2-kinase